MDSITTKMLLSAILLSQLIALTLSLASLEDDCTDDWVWGDCVPWNLDKATGCGTEGRQEAKREGTGCQIIAFQIKCIPECNKKGKSGDKNDNAGKQTPDQDRDEVDSFEDNGIGLWGVDNEPDEESNGKKGGCQYKVKTEWSKCDRNGHQFRSKELLTGSPKFCSKVVDEVQQCAGAGTGWQAEPEGISDAGSPGGWLPIPPSGGETPSMPSDEPRDEEKEMKKEECRYSKFGAWSKCVGGQKYRTQNLKRGHEKCVSQNTQYRSCTSERKTGCQYLRSEKKCGKCNKEIPRKKVCHAPLNQEESSSSCNKSLRIEKPC
ncbi:uncharacterized protein LOC134847669 [Symsagittifera roscoffensis]|uniref:uncharacterized protein LOC134847669 n=1 Tax=Symsagittifera roscoffensis TaxID=84072 RepID=UPI00307B6741